MSRGRGKHDSTASPMIVLDDTLVGIWYVCVNEACDWMAGVSRTDAGFKLAWRMKYYAAASVNPHDGQDQRHSYVAVSHQPEAVVIEQIRTVARMLTQHAEGALFEVLRGNRNLDAFQDEVLRQPWANVALASVTLTSAYPPGRRG